MMAAVVALIPGSGLTSAVCAALEVSRASVYRHRVALVAPPRTEKPRQHSARALSESEPDQVLALLSTPRFANQTSTEVYAILLRIPRKMGICSTRSWALIPRHRGKPFLAIVGS